VQSKEIVHCPNHSDFQTNPIVASADGYYVPVLTEQKRHFLLYNALTQCLYTSMSFYIFGDTMKTLIQLVHRNKASGHKFVTIPKGEDINEGDYVVVKKVMPDDLQGSLSIEVSK